MGTLIVKPVETRRERKQFIQLAWDLYRDDPNWIPPLRQNIEELVGFRKHPFYDHAVGQPLLALRDGQPVGRVLAIDNEYHNQRYQEKRGMFGFFECTDDQEVANALFDEARKWLAARDLHSVRGPINPSLNYECGLLTQGFDSTPYFMMTYNPPYYAKLIETYGFQKVQDLYAFWGEMSMLDGLDKKLKFVVEEATKRFNVKLRRMDTSKFRQEVATFLHIYNESMAGTWGFTPLSKEEMEHMGASLKHLIVPELTTIAEVDGRPVACVFGLLDYNPRIKKIDGRLFPFGFLRLLWNRKAIKNVRLISTNVLPEFQRWGLGLVVLARLVPDLLAWGVKEIEFSWVLESNHLSFKSLQRGGAKISKQYRIYDFPAPPPASPELGANSVPQP